MQRQASETNHLNLHEIKIIPMLKDPKAIEIISHAKQKNVALENRSGRDFQNVFTDFFDKHDFTNQRIMDLGPGQYDFARRVRDRKGIVEHIDKDDAVIELGNYLGFEVTKGNLQSFDYAQRSARYDGIFCKFSINVFWFDSVEDVKSKIVAINEMLKPNGWGWIAPWNGLPKKRWENRDPQEFLDSQAESFGECGWIAYDLPEELTMRYGITGSVLNHPLFVKNLDCSKALASATQISCTGTRRI